MKKDIHDDIMNLPVGGSYEALNINQRLAYKIGHRDARHAAAELAVADLAAKVEPFAWAAQNTQSMKYAYIWHEEDDVRGWINLQHQSNDIGTYRLIPLYSSPQQADLAAKVEPVGLQDAVLAVCEGWTLPAGARKMLESALYAAPQQAEAPAGWKLVPIEPTQEMMLEAGGWEYGEVPAKIIYRKMIAAAPRSEA